MKKLLTIGLFSIFSMLGLAHGASPVRYVQISTNPVTQQSGGFNTSTGTVAGFVASTMTITSSATIKAALDMSNQKVINITSGTVAGDATRYSQNKLLNLQAFSISAASATTAATFGKSTLSGSITPSTVASRIRIVGAFTGTSSNVGFTCEYKITRNGSDITTGPVIDWGGAGTATGSLGYNIALTGVDSPATTSSTTYEISFRNLSGGITCGVGSGALISVLTLEEINGL